MVSAGPSVKTDGPGGVRPVVRKAWRTAVQKAAGLLSPGSRLSHAMTVPAGLCWDAQSETVDVLPQPGPALTRVRRRLTARSSLAARSGRGTMPAGADGIAVLAPRSPSLIEVELPDDVCRANATAASPRAGSGMASGYCAYAGVRQLGAGEAPVGCGPSRVASATDQIRPSWLVACRRCGTATRGGHRNEREDLAPGPDPSPARAVGDPRQATRASGSNLSRFGRSRMRPRIVEPLEVLRGGLGGSAQRTHHYDRCSAARASSLGADYWRC